MSSTVKTRFLILSDTHGKQPFAEHELSRQDGNAVRVNGFRWPLPAADVAIHCGDLTYRTELREYEATFAMMRRVNAPLKLVIAGNHDVALDSATWAGLADEVAARGAPAAHVAEMRARPAAVRRVIDDARADGVAYLPRGLHRFALANGAALAVFASPMTPEYGRWGFQYARGVGGGAYRHGVPEGVDVAVTHGPPAGVLDRNYAGTSCGCEALLGEVARARPRLHCFGHIHEAWGARLVRWRHGEVAVGGVGGLADVVDERGSRVLGDLGDLTPGMWDDDESWAEKLSVVNGKARDMCSALDLTSSSDAALEYGKETLFVNAAIMSVQYRPHQLPWLVDLDLSRGDKS